MRQLENAVFRAVVLADGDEIGAGEFPQLLHARLCAPTIAPAVDDIPQHAAHSAAPLLLNDSPTTSPLTHAPGPSTAHGALALLDAAGNVRPLDEVEAEVIRFAIAHHRGQMSEVARRLRIGRSTLYRKLDDLGLGGEKSGETEENVATG